MADLEEALVKHRSNHITGSEMAETRKKWIESHIQNRLTQLEELPTSIGEDLQSKCLLELYGLKLIKVDKRRNEMLRLTKLEEEEKNRVETRKRKFFAEILNAIRELQLQVQASQKRRKQRNDVVQMCILSSVLDKCLRLLAFESAAPCDTSCKLRYVALLFRIALVF
ncbi:unnamed protein product [Lactuca saligna]|uniref:Uncharacterized protein n=1 Tax=Lactuca saligna TaxID=75948 RepID=A0AA35Z2J2_LACSI|nr:unnamed protein product [Lactuca saligna]